MTSVVEPKEDILQRTAKLVPGLGLILAISSGIVFASAAFTVELIPNVNATWAVIYRSIVQLIVYGLAAVIQRDSLIIIPSERIYVAICSICSSCFISGYYALRFMTFSDVSTIAMSSPVFVAPLAYFFLREPCGAFQFLVICSTIVGVVLIARPTFLFDWSAAAAFSPEENVLGATLAIMCSLGMATIMVSLRKCTKTPATVFVVWFSTGSILSGLVLVTILQFVAGVEVELPRTSSDWFWLNANALCGVFGQFMFVCSLKLEEASLVSLLRTFDIVVAFVLQITFTEQHIFWTSIVGALVVCGSVVLICLKRLWQTRPDFFSGLTQRKAADRKDVS